MSFYSFKIQSLLRAPTRCLQAHPTLDVYILVNRERQERRECHDHVLAFELKAT